MIKIVFFLIKVNSFSKEEGKLLHKQENQPLHEDPNKILLGNNLVSTVVAPISTIPSANLSLTSPDENSQKEKVTQLFNKLEMFNC